MLYLSLNQFQCLLQNHVPLHCSVVIRCTKLEPYTEFGHAEAAGEAKRPGVCGDGAARKSLLIPNHSRTQVKSGEA